MKTFHKFPLRSRRLISVIIHFPQCHHEAYMMNKIEAFHSDSLLAFSLIPFTRWEKVMRSGFSVITRVGVCLHRVFNSTSTCEHLSTCHREIRQAFTPLAIDVEHSFHCANVFDKKYFRMYYMVM